MLGTADPQGSLLGVDSLLARLFEGDETSFYRAWPPAVTSSSPTRTSPSVTGGQGPALDPAVAVDAGGAVPDPRRRLGPGGGPSCRQGSGLEAGAGHRGRRDPVPPHDAVGVPLPAAGQRRRRDGAAAHDRAGGGRGLVPQEGAGDRGLDGGDGRGRGGRHLRAVAGRDRQADRRGGRAQAAAGGAAQAGPGLRAGQGRHRLGRCRRLGAPSWARSSLWPESSWPSPPSDEECAEAAELLERVIDQDIDEDPDDGAGPAIRQRCRSGPGGLGGRSRDAPRPQEPRSAASTATRPTCSATTTPSWCSAWPRRRRTHPTGPRPRRWSPRPGPPARGDRGAGRHRLWRR